jgi:hypothetical protein
VETIFWRGLARLRPSAGRLASGTAPWWEPATNIPPPAEQAVPVADSGGNVAEDRSKAGHKIALAQVQTCKLIFG